MLNVAILNVVMLNVIMPNVIMLNAIVLNDILLNVIMLNVIMLNVIMLNVIMLSGGMLNVMEPNLFTSAATVLVVLAVALNRFLLAKGPEVKSWCVLLWRRKFVSSFKHA
jgi:hypothetical protein